MNDRELLERAAKAAGMPTPMMLGDKGLSFGNGWWNPLTDDGDALRLAVKLGLCVTQESTPSGRRVFAGGCLVRMPYTERNEPTGADPYAATRRAIVTAAASMVEDQK